MSNITNLNITEICGNVMVLSNFYINKYEHYISSLYLFFYFCMRDLIIFPSIKDINSVDVATIGTPASLACFFFTFWYVCSSDEDSGLVIESSWDENNGRRTT